jgi:ABC-type proline/glycine betaine transport system ATPase subunit
LIAFTTLQNSLFRPVTGLLSTGVSVISSLALFAQIFEIDGTGLRDLRLADLAAIVGVVSQETYLLHATVRENLRYAKPSATDAEIEDAARAAQIHDLIASLPDGYDTMVGSRGHRFSGGEKQRIAIARTLLRDPRVLVLDEATSALDTETERAVQQAFDTLARAAPRSPSRTGCPPSAMPTRSPCRITAGSSRPATTPACSPARAATPNWPQRPSMRGRSLGWLSVARSR